MSGDVMLSNVVLKCMLFVGCNALFVSTSISTAAAEAVQPIARVILVGTSNAMHFYVHSDNGIARYVRFHRNLNRYIASARSGAENQGIFSSNNQTTWLVFENGSAQLVNQEAIVVDPLVQDEIPDSQ